MMISTKVKVSLIGFTLISYSILIVPNSISGLRIPQQLSGIELDSDYNELEEPLFLKDIANGFKAFAKAFKPKKGTIADVKLLLYQPKLSQKWETIGVGNDSSAINTKNIKAGKPFRIAIHGFLQNCNSSDFPEVIFKAYMDVKEDSNFLCVDWGSLANPGTITQIGSLFHYPKAVNYTILVGDVTALFLDSLMTKKLITKTDSIHLIGLSLGAHIAGICGHEFFDKKKKKVGRITGLDPAGPFFYKKDAESKAKLGINDAAFVDIIHSNSGRLGTNESIGHACFLPNGGQTQPYCKTGNMLEDIAENVTGMCSHVSSARMFAKSIRQKMPACACKSWEQYVNSTDTCNQSKVAYFGENVSHKLRGKFCLHVKSL